MGKWTHAEKFDKVLPSLGNLLPDTITLEVVYISEWNKIIYIGEILSFSKALKVGLIRTKTSSKIAEENR